MWAWPARWWTCCIFVSLLRDMLSTWWTCPFIPIQVWTKPRYTFSVMGFLVVMVFRTLALQIVLHGDLGITSRNHMARSEYDVQHSRGQGQYYCQLWPDGSGPHYQILKKKISLSEGWVIWLLALWGTSVCSSLLSRDPDSHLLSYGFIITLILCKAVPPCIHQIQGPAQITTLLYYKIISM